MEDLAKGWMIILSMFVLVPLFVLLPMHILTHQLQRREQVLFRIVSARWYNDSVQRLLIESDDNFLKGSDFFYDGKYWSTYIDTPAVDTQYNALRCPVEQYNLAVHNIDVGGCTPLLVPGQPKPQQPKPQDDPAYEYLYWDL